jgi:hypothetical protein
MGGRRMKINPKIYPWIPIFGWIMVVLCKGKDTGIHKMSIFLGSLALQSISFVSFQIYLILKIIN